MIDRKKILNEIQIISNNFQSKKYLETISKSKKLLHSLPNNEFLNNMIGLSYLNIGNIEDAKNLYLRITKSAPSIISYQNNYANVLKAQNKFDEAENILEKILDRKPDYLNALNNLANLKKTLGKNEEAIKLFEKALISWNQKIQLYYIILPYVTEV
jgi:protein O-GlcNAc transferase